MLTKKQTVMAELWAPENSKPSTHRNNLGDGCTSTTQPKVENFGGTFVKNFNKYYSRATKNRWESKENGYFTLIASDEYGSKAVLTLLPDCTVYSYLTNGILDIFLAALSYESFFLQIWHVLKYCNPRVVLAKN